jgi:hypothetical protein
MFTHRRAATMLANLPGRALTCSPVSASDSPCIRWQRWITEALVVGRAGPVRRVLLHGA